MKKLLLAFLLFVLHLSAVSIIIGAFWPIGKWYFDAKPLWGVDFYYTASLVNSLKQNFIFPAAGWFSAWFSGWPWITGFPILHAYLIVPLTYFFEVNQAIKIWMLVSLILYFLGAYALFYVLSRNWVIAVLLSLGAIFSVGVYGSLMWGGSLPSHATQMFFPWVILFVVLFLTTRKRAALWLAILLTGLSIWGHPQIAIAYIYPTAGLLFLFLAQGLKIWHRLKSLIVFVLVSFVFGLPLFYFTFGDALKTLIVTNSTEVATSTAKVDATASAEIAAFHGAQPWRIIQDTNLTFYYLLAGATVFFVLVLILRRQPKMLFESLPFLVVAIFYVVYVWIFAYGISIYHGGWYRLFWATPIWLGMVVASLWGTAQKHLYEKATGFWKIFHILIPVASLVILGAGAISLNTTSQGLKEKIVARSNTSSAFPDVLNLRTGSGFTALTYDLVPTWLDGNRRDYRLYSADQTVNIWWSAVFAMPLARGYFDPPVNAQNRGYFFWLDAALNKATNGDDELVGAFHYPPETALNNTLFLVDWYGVKFFEAGHAGPTAYAPLPTSFSQKTYMANEVDLPFNTEKYNQGNQALHFYELKDEKVSPLLIGTNAVTLGIVATDQGYETVVRALADSNLGVSQLIPVKLGSDLNQLSEKTLAAMDGLLLYDYHYSNQQSAFRQIVEYVKGGKQLFIDSGTETREANSQNLPEVFPIETSIRKQLGEAWDFTEVDDGLTRGIDLTSFDPPLFDQTAWNFSYPPDSSAVRTGSKVLLKNHGQPVLMSLPLGSGEVIWSGMNLSYHVIRFHNRQEVAFYKNIITKIVKLGSQDKIESDAEFINPETRRIRISQSKGVLLKEEAYPGWRATIRTDKAKESAKIYPVGPSYPGFMYIRIPTRFQNIPSEVTFHYSGSTTTWGLVGVTLLIGITILDEVVLKGAILGRLCRKVWQTINFETKKWWGKEDE
ncbi:hypothetical protein A3A59_03830 [Candidatus Gottesmanbacteria bacterium RIFCSPLOWO2_01_FULL_42_10]|nr:MAG: hypothetical protein A3A59_03830 [Candidatus Gottesmanbacteria bacterium RIFCSPLOWO2_01_FULL_42_10]